MPIIRIKRRPNKTVERIKFLINSGIKINMIDEDEDMLNIQTLNEVNNTFLSRDNDLKTTKF